MGATGTSVAHAMQGHEYTAAHSMMSIVCWLSAGCLPGIWANKRAPRRQGQDVQQVKTLAAVAEHRQSSSSPAIPAVQGTPGGRCAKRIPSCCTSCCSCFQTALRAACTSPTLFMLKHCVRLITPPLLPVLWLRSHYHTRPCQNNPRTAYQAYMYPQQKPV